MGLKLKLNLVFVVERSDGTSDTSTQRSRPLNLKACLLPVLGKLSPSLLIQALAVSKKVKNYKRIS